MRAIAQGGIVLAACKPHEAAWVAEAVAARLALAGPDDLGDAERALLETTVEQLAGVAARIDPRLVQSMRRGQVRPEVLQPVVRRREAAAS
jgi:hypothetical protein